MKLKKIVLNLAITGFILLFACSNIPEGVKAVQQFDKEKYLGKWYEIARIDFRYEKDLNNTTADYSLNNDGSIKVVNRGFNYKTMKWQQAVGRAKFAGNDNVGMLKVSFFGPFYSGYNVMAIDPGYKYALVAGKNLSYLWILSRDTTIPENVKQDYLKTAENYGFKTSSLLWIEHNMK